MDWLNEYDNWQIELLIFGSQLRLNLLNKSQIIDFINLLMDKGLYDDLMLNIIDDDPIYPAGGFQEIYQQIAQNLQLPFPTVEQARWILTLDALVRFLASPYYYGYFQLDEYNSIYQKFEMFFDNWQEIYQGIEEFRYLLYRIDDAEFDYLHRNQQSFADLKFIQSLEAEFFLMVDDWFNHNSVRLENIFSELLDKN